MAEVKWIKLTTDIFDDEKILMIESLPSADTIIVIWFKLLTLAGKSNNNGVFMMNNRIPYTDEMLAAIFRRDDKIVKLALRTFQQFGMIEIIDDVITIPNWDKHQSLDAYEKKKERDRRLQAERRAKQKALIGKSSDNRLTLCDSSSDVAVSEEEKEEDKEKDFFTTTTDEPPMLSEVYLYFKELLDEDAINEAEKFHAYNANKGWSCLPDWRATADLWIARIKDHKVGK
jgi:predicted phage replisome organizer